MRVRVGLYPIVAVVAAISQHHALAAAGDDSVIRWSENAGVAATKACITPDEVIHSTSCVSTRSCTLLFMMR